MAHESRSPKFEVGLAAFQLGDAVAVAAKMPYLMRALDRVDCPPAVRTALPVVKAASAVGLVAGTRSPAVARLTSSALIAYFLVALGFHIRSKDSAANALPAVAMLGISVFSLRRSLRSASR